MKILHLGLCVYGQPYEGLETAFNNAASHYVGISTNEDNLGSKLMSVANSLKPDLFFMQVQNERIGYRSKYDTIKELIPVIQFLKSIGCFIVNWNGDIRPQTPSWMISLSKHIDVTAFSNMRDVHKVRSYGARSEFLQIGMDELIFNNTGDVKREADIVFFFNRNRYPLSAWRENVSSQLAHRFKSQYASYGNHNTRGKRGDTNGNQHLEASIYRGAKIAINISQFDVDRYTSDRMFRAMCSGVMVMSHRYAGIEKDFEVGKHLDVFDSVSELNEKCKFYLENETDRKRIADDGYALGHSRYLYKNMVENVISFMK